MDCIIQCLENRSSNKESVWRFPAESEDRPASTLITQAAAFEKELHRIGIKKAHRIGLFFEAHWSYVAMLVAIWRLNAIAVPLLPKSKIQSEFARTHQNEIDSFRLFIYGGATREDVLMHWLEFYSTTAFPLDHFEEIAQTESLRYGVKSKIEIELNDIAVIKLPCRYDKNLHSGLITHSNLLELIGWENTDAEMPGEGGEIEEQYTMQSLITNLVAAVTMPVAV